MIVFLAVTFILGLSMVFFALSEASASRGRLSKRWYVLGLAGWGLAFFAGLTALTLLGGSS